MFSIAQFINELLEKALREIVQRFQNVIGSVFPNVLF